MLIVCPTCASRYSIDDDKIGPEGRMVRCASCRADFFVAAPVTAADDAAPGAEAPRETQAAQAPQPAHAAPLAKTARRSADDDLAAAWLEEAGLEPDPPPEPEPVPEGTPLPAELATVAPADQAALDALFEQELAAARSLAAATESGEADHGSAAGLAGSDGKAPRSAGWRGLLARLLPGGKGRHRAADAGRRKAARPGTGSRAKRQGTGKEQGGAGRRLKGPVGIGIASALILGALIMQRETVVRLAPASATLFGKLGLDVNINGLDFAEIRSTVQREGDQRILVVEGRVISVDQRTVTVPLIEVRVRGADGSTLYAWTTEPPRTSLKPGEALHFRTRLATPPEAGRHVEVRFTDQAQGARART